MVQSSASALNDKYGQTDRNDNWWLGPLSVAVGLGIFALYVTFRAFEGEFYEWGPYLSPFCSPKFEFEWWPYSPALLILWAPGVFRASCYYYRKAYYRAFFADPPACSVGEPRPPKSYNGETKFPFVLWNLHRYTLYIAIIFIFILAYDAVIAFDFDGKFGVGLGSLIMTANVVLLALYTFSCHSWRHIVAGKLDCFSCSALTKVRHKGWQRISLINEHHMLWAWLSLASVGLTDVYITLCARGIITDWRIF